MDKSKPAFPTSKRKTENYMDEGGYGRTRIVTIDEGGMTLREYAAVKLRVPESGDEQLDAMIRTANRRDVATAAMQGVCPEATIHDAKALAECAVTFADALIARLEEDK